MEMIGLEAVIRLLDADSAVINANAVGLPPTARARLMAMGTITMVAPTWLMTSENEVVSSASTICTGHGAVPSGSTARVLAATHAAAPLLSMAQPSGIRPAVRNTVFQLIAE